MSKTEVVPWHGMREAPIVLVTGPESYLADRVFRELRDRVRIAQPELEVTDLDGATYAVGTLLDVASPSLFGEPRMIRIANGESGGDDFVADFQSYLDVIADDVIVMVRHGGGNRGKKLLDTLRAHPATLEVECAVITREADRVQFATAEFNRLGVKADRLAVGALVEAFAGDLAELAAACEQISSDALGQLITKDLVDTYYEGREEVTSFAVADMAIDGNRAEALRLLRHAIQSGVDPVPLIAAFAAKLRQLAKVGGYTGSPSNASKELGLPSWMIDKSRSALRKWTGPTLGSAILAVAEADSMVKGAGRDPEFAVERMVDRVASRS
ncbi:MAG: polymerase subunit delta [Actinomycetota bacterium]